MISTSRHPARLMASAVRQISAFVMFISFICENVVGPKSPGSGALGRSDRESASARFRADLVRPPGFSGFGFLFMLLSHAFKDGHFRKSEISLPLSSANFTPAKRRRALSLHGDASGERKAVSRYAWSEPDWHNRTPKTCVISQ